MSQQPVSHQAGRPHALPASEGQNVPWCNLQRTRANRTWDDVGGRGREHCQTTGGVEVKGVPRETNERTHEDCVQHGGTQTATIECDWLREFEKELACIIVKSYRDAVLASLCDSWNSLRAMGGGSFVMIGNSGVSATGNSISSISSGNDQYDTWVT